MKTALLLRSLTFVVLLSATMSPADVVIPSSVYRRGAGGAEFRSDVRVFNPTTSPVNYTPVLYDQVTGQTFTAAIQTIPSRTQQSFDNIVGTLFGRTLDNGSFGPIRFQTSGTLLVSSSVNNYNACGNGSVSGQWLPGLDAAAALKAGTLVQLASSVDLAAGYRTNVVFTNPGSSDATVRAKVRRGDGTLVSDATLPALGPNGFTQIGNWGPPFSGVAGTNDTNLWIEFTSDQPVLSFASVINNASGDPFAIVMTSEPAAPPAAPVANYTVSASPQPNQPVTFTDLSTGTPTNRFWVFGDGTFATNPVAPVQHTYTAAGTYKSALFVDNAAGASSKTQDVVVASATPIAVTISATTTNNTKWTFVCQTGPCSGAGNNNVNLKVGQPYTITWTTPASEAKTHGVGGIAVLNITQCDVIRSNQPCTASLTPTASMLNFPGPVYTYFCTQSACGTQPQHDGMSGTITIVP
ncbi:MAG TPA: PKD domain-containing protein [Thermoanaerobaculia bacterium]|nr:PKD domain-containing protein [Thermoanaerobaculia bacterium]